MKKKYYVLSLIICSMMFCACGKSDAIDTQLDTNDLVIEENDIDDRNDIEADNDDLSEELNFDKLSKFRYEFSSGAGAWSTELIIEKDGYFHGLYHDSDMGDFADEYPDGTVYTSVFSGHFENVNKIDNNKYEMRLKDISYKYTPGTEELADGFKYVYSEAYGISNSEVFEIYIPGTLVSGLDEEIYSWIRMSNGESDTLTSYCIVNQNEKTAFSSHERGSASEEAHFIYTSYKSSYDYMLEELQNLSTTFDMLVNAENRYKLADDCLNELWILVKYNTDEDQFEKILDEQRAWLKSMEEEAQSNYDSWEGGTFAPVDCADTKATLTMDRCDALYQVLNK